MSKTFEEYLDDIEKNGDTFPISKFHKPQRKPKLIGPNNKYIELKTPIGLNYFNTKDKEIVYIEDISENKKFTNDLNTKEFKLHLTENLLYIDFNTDYYYELYDFDTFEQFEYCIKNKKLTIALLNEDKSDIINKWTIDVNLL